MELASQISSLFNFDIPPLAVGVIFIDDAREVVTLTNEKDLRDFFDKFSSLSYRIY